MPFVVLERISSICKQEMFKYREISETSHFTELNAVVRVGYGFLMGNAE